MALPAIETGTGGAGNLTNPPWSQQRSTERVQYDGSGALKGDTGATDHYAFWNLDVFDAAHYAKLIIGPGLSSGGEYVYCTVCAVGTTDATFDNYVFYTDGDTGAGHTELAEVLDGVTTVLRNFATTFTTNDEIEVDVDSGVLTCYKNGGSLGTQGDSTLSGGAAGLGIYNNTVTILSWEGGNLTVSPSAAVSGTITSATDEDDIVTGGKTVILTLSLASWIP